MPYANVGGIRDPVKQEITLEFWRNENKDICILSKTHINHEQIHQIKNNWLGPIFFLSWSYLSKVYLACFIKDLLMLLRLTQIQKEDLSPSKLLLLGTELFVSMLLQDIATENNWLGGASLENYKIIWKTNFREMETK